MEAITIPPIFCPFPPETNPYVEMAQQHVLEWVQRYGLIRKELARQRFMRADFGRFAACTYPTIGMDDLALVSDWFVWLFLIDDQLDDGTLGTHLDKAREVTEAFLSVLSGACDIQSIDSSGSYSAAVVALADLWQRTSPDAPPAWCRRFYRHVADCFVAAQWEAHNRIQGVIPDVDEYIKKRPHTGAIYICLDLIDIVQRIDIPVDIYEHTAFQTLLDTASNVIAWCNDIYSLEKEIKRGEYHNLALLIRYADRSSLQEALFKANEMVKGEIQQFLEAGQQIQGMFPEHAEDIQTYIEGMKSWMRGNIDWSSTTRRYTWIEEASSRESIEYIERIV